MMPEHYYLRHPHHFSTAIIQWYLQNQRPLPWRRTGDPYHIWVSEIILQQTRVTQGLPYYHHFITTYPTIFALAKATEEKVLRSWQGLGYYTRARNMHACAKKIIKEHQGNFPAEYENLIKLPGIGPYTAAAICSIAFNVAKPVIDGNVYRVLARIFGVEMDMTSAAGVKHFSILAEKLINKQHPGVYNQALMELGALQCLPKRPDCANCPLQHYCVAYLSQVQHKLPVKKKKKSPRKRFLHYFLIKAGNEYLFKKRASKDIWAGLYEPYLIERDCLLSLRELTLDDAFIASLKIAPDMAIFSRKYRHVLTHQVLDAAFYYIELASIEGVCKKKMEEKTLEKVSKKKMMSLPKPQLINNFLVDVELS